MRSLALLLPALGGAAYVLPRVSLSPFHVPQGASGSSSSSSLGRRCSAPRLQELATAPADAGAMAPEEMPRVFPSSCPSCETDYLERSKIAEPRWLGDRPSLIVNDRHVSALRPGVRVATQRPSMPSLLALQSRSCGSCAKKERAKMLRGLKSKPASMQLSTRPRHKPSSLRGTHKKRHVKEL